MDSIKGIKFQASVLNNYNLFESLSEFDLSGKIIILNIASYTTEQIEEISKRIQKLLKPKEIVLQIGFQDFPTDFLDSGLSKIEILKGKFRNRISFTEHIDAQSEESLYLPVFASILGVEIIEKHVRHSKLKTEFDFQSSIPLEKYKKYLDIQKKYQEALNQPFINKKEKLYLAKTLQTPILNKFKESGDFLNIKNDLDFKRSGKKGLNIYEINELLEKFYILAKGKKLGDVLQKNDFRKAKIAAIVACRLKSKRLPKKAILKIGKLSSVELCLKNALQLKNIDYTVLATSDLPDDDELKNHTFSESVILHRGHPEDVIDRFLVIIDKLKIDVVVRFGADIIYPSDDILQILLKSHFESGADYTAAKKSAHGTSMEIMNVSALKKLKKFFPSADYSEYMTYYFTNNPLHFKLNFVDLPKNLVRNYRLTLDYKEDLELFNVIENYFENNNLRYGIANLFEFLDKNPKIAEINKNIKQIYVADKNLAEKLKKETTIK